MQIRFILYLIFHIYKFEKSGGCVGMVNQNIKFCCAVSNSQREKKELHLKIQLYGIIFG